MAKRKISKELEVDGGLFNPNGGGGRALLDAIADGIKEQGEKGREIMVALIERTGFVDTGDYVSGVEAKFTRSSRLTAGFALVATTDDYQAHGAGRPTDTWLAKGTRKGKKLRKGSDVFTQTSTRLKDAHYEEIAAAITKALD